MAFTFSVETQISFSPPQYCQLLESNRIYLELYVDNLAQPYYSSYVKEKKREVNAFVEKLEKENPDLSYDEFLKHSLEAIAKRLGADYGKHSVDEL
ncbi:MAG: hypothetical protein IPN76_18680 [Saprospiraceae bacterium]|nr:hypothetical protein [Saprospiraceae bacterium]